MRVLMPSRILDRHTGGNTTYARHVATGLSQRGIEVARIPAGRHPSITMLQETLTGLARGQAGDVLHYVADTGPLMRTRRPSVITVHGVASRWISSARTARQEKVWRTRVQRAIDSTTHVVTVSNSSANDVQEIFGVEPERLTTIEHGIDVQRFTTATELSKEVRAQLPERFALYLGNIEPRKNLVALVKAFAAPEVRALGVKLVVAGKPAWNAEESLAVMDRSPDVIRLGFVSDDDRTALMQNCDVFVFPSLYEGFGFPVLEALAAGAVVLTSNKGSLEEVAGPALRLESVDEEAIAHGLARAFEDESARKQCREQGRAWASRYTWDASVERHIEVYRKVSS
ncbi:glycosyltransferase family 1 protein [Microbacterium oryzae]|uniref:Glycosyltransferase family 1 protein n=1 Tax=Microbacterium oryzae TaxID=743009 RepID=A0A6I6DTX7_9MICO|nr:glycosyltransferase family 1 protein [Microbacterium oryzae]QGU27566.1 glycosyltransferase family 1 protein [Microbacterium oryzae]